MISKLRKEPIQVVFATPNGAGILHKETFKFSAGETQVRLSQLPPEATSITVTADVFSSDHLVELLLTLDAINRLPYQGPVELFLPYLPYSRQDRACAPGEAFALSVLVNSVVPYLGLGDTMTTWDAHSDVAKSLFESGFEGTFKNVSAASRLFALGLQDNFFDSSTIVVAPDKGAVGRASEVQETLELKETIYATKVRNPDNGQILRTEVPEDVDYRGKSLLIVDDICDGGRTFIELAKVLRQHGPKRIDLYVTHGIFSKGFEVFENLINQFYVANLLPNKLFYEHLPANLTYLRSAS